MKFKRITLLVLIFVGAFLAVVVTNQYSTAAPQATTFTFLPIISKPAIDLSITGIEVTQGIQKVDNSVPLVADRPTIVRVFADINSGTPENNITVSLSGTRGGSPLGTVTSGPGTVTQDPQRSSYSSTFNVTLPASWLSGNVQLVATVDSADVLVESNEGNNSHTELVTFNSVPDLKIHILPIAYTHTGSTDPGFYPAPSVDYVSDWVMRVFPVDNVQVVIEPPYSFTGDLEGGASWDVLLPAVETWKELNVGITSSAIVYGFIPISNGSQQWFFSGIAGYGYLGDRTSIGLNLGNNDTTGALAGHEFGHNLGRRHAPCGGPANVDPNYPDPGASIIEFGLDGIEAGLPSLKSPTAYVDFMSYCDPAWISDYTYTALYNDQVSNGAFVLTAVSPTNSLLIRGQVDESGLISLDPVYAFEQMPSEPVENGGYLIELLDESGKVIAQHPVDVAYAEEEGISLRAIFAAVPLPETAVSSVRIISAHSPAMATASLSSAQAFNLNLANNTMLTQSPQIETVTLRWNAANGPALARYTPDDGESWIMLGVDLEGGELVVDTSRLPGGVNGRFEIISANSSQPVVQTAVLETPLPNLTPQSWITGPTAVKVNQPAFLYGHGSDPEDGAIAELRWLIDGQPVEATNSLPLQGLSVGEHTITLIVQDSAGNESSAEYVVVVEQD